MHNISFWIAGVTGLLIAGVEAAPVVIWASDPVRPGETVVVRGDAFGGKVKVEVAVSGQGEWKPAEVLQQTERTLKFVLPAAMPAGVVLFRVGVAGVFSEVRKLNAPQVWWMQGNEVETATPGGWIRLFGLNLGLPAGAKLILRSGATSHSLKLVSVDEYNFQAEVPKGISLGRYKVEFVTRESVEVGEIGVVNPPPFKKRRSTE